AATDAATASFRPSSAFERRSADRGAAGARVRRCPGLRAGARAGSDQAAHALGERAAHLAHGALGPLALLTQRALGPLALLTHGALDAGAVLVEQLLGLGALLAQVALEPLAAAAHAAAQLAARLEAAALEAAQLALDLGA